MPQIVRTTTVQNLVDRVGVLIDMPISANSSPSESNVRQWFDDAALWIATLLPEGNLGFLSTTISMTAGQRLVLDSTNDLNKVLRPVSVKKFGVACMKVDPAQFLRVSTIMPMLYSSRNPIYMVTGQAGALALEFLPSIEGPVDLTALMRPSSYLANPWVVDAWTPPAEWESYLIGYAVLQAKIQDEEPEQYQILRKDWLQSLSALGADNLLGGEG